jgi:predicted nucleotidyltransferase
MFLVALKQYYLGTFLSLPILEKRKLRHSLGRPSRSDFVQFQVAKQLEKFEFGEVIKMIDITVWMKNFLQTLNETFGDRVWFVGLQGSYGRGEATETSDIDVVVILDELSTMDIQTYNTMLDTLPHRELICGFLSGKNEIMNWESSDLFQFCHNTTQIKGSIDEVMAVIDESAVNRAIKIGACNIYHGCVHNMLYEKSEDILRGLYKSASFVVQAIVFQQTGRYIKHQEELLTVARLNEQAIINTFLSLKKGGIVDFILMSDTLFDWAKQWISKNS